MRSSGEAFSNRDQAQLNHMWTFHALNLHIDQMLPQVHQNVIQMLSIVM